MLTQRCLCPPVVSINQEGYDCKAGNRLQCDKLMQANETLRGELLKGLSKEAFRDTNALTVEYKSLIGSQNLLFSDITKVDSTRTLVRKNAELAKKEYCTQYESGRSRMPILCSD
jgi:hypothetical protein